MSWWRRKAHESADDAAVDVGVTEQVSYDTSGVRVIPPGELRDATTHEPTPAALDELHQSFGVEAPAQETARKVLIADDGLPDAVILGDDADLGVVSEPSTTMDPRIRDRRIAVRRLQGRRRLRWVVIGGAVVVVIVGVLVVLASPLFSVRQVDVDGAVYTTRFDVDLLDEVVESLEGEPILIADLAAAQRRLEESPWVRSARVTMQFPDRVLIEIRERTPLAWYLGADGGHRVIDDEGRVIVVLDGQPVDYVEVTGPGPEVGPGDFTSAAHRAAAQMVRAFPDELRPQVANLGVTEDGELTMGLVAGTEVRFGLPEDLQNKLVALVVVLRRTPAESIDLIDVSSGEPTVR